MFSYGYISGRNGRRTEPQPGDRTALSWSELAERQQRCPQPGLVHHPDQGSTYGSLKGEVGNRFSYDAEAKAELFDYIEVFYNHRHSSAGRTSPADFERTMTHAAQLKRPPGRIKRSSVNMLPNTTCFCRRWRNRDRHG